MKSKTRSQSAYIALKSASPAGNNGHDTSTDDGATESIVNVKYEQESPPATEQVCVPFSMLIGLLFLRKRAKISKSGKPCLSHYFMNRVRLLSGTALYALKYFTDQ